MDMTLAELQEMAARQQQQIEAQQQLLASKVCESTRWKVGACTEISWNAGYKSCIDRDKSERERRRGSKYWGNNKVDVVMRMWGDTLLRSIWPKAWKRMECRLWPTGDIWMAETAACLFFPVWTHLLVYYFLSISVACLLSTGNRDSVLCFHFFWVNCILMHW